MLNLVDHTKQTELVNNKVVPFTANAKEWVATVIKDTGLSLLDTKHSLLLDELYLLGQSRVVKISRSLIEAALNVCVEEAHQARLDQLKTKIAYVEPNGLLEKYVKAMAKDPSPMEIAKIATFIWQVKRKMFGLDVDSPSMIVLTGGQEGGKSHTVEKQLCGPVKDYIFRTDFSVFEKTFMAPAFEQYFVFFFDEMPKIKKADLERVKSLITGNFQSERGFKSAHFVKSITNTTLIGTTNEDLSVLLTDYTGARRFFELETLPPYDFQKNHPILESIDYVSLWQGINENGPNPILPYKALLRQQQATNLTPPHHIVEFMEDCIVIDPTAFTSSGEIERIYNIWIRKYRPKQPTWDRSSLIKRLSNLGCAPVKQMGIRGLAVKLIPIKEDSSVGY